MKPEPLKDKLCRSCITKNYVTVNNHKYFEVKDIFSAVEWLLEKTHIRVQATEIKSKYYLDADEVRETIKEAFEDVMK